MFSILLEGINIYYAIKVILESLYIETSGQNILSDNNYSRVILRQSSGDGLEVSR